MFGLFGHRAHDSDEYFTLMHTGPLILSKAFAHLGIWALGVDECFTRVGQCALDVDDCFTHLDIWDPGFDECLAVLDIGPLLLSNVSHFWRLNA